MVSLQHLVDPALVFTDVDGSSRDAALRGLAERLERGGAIPSAADLHARLLEREQQGSTAIGRGVAIPHCKLEQIDRSVVAVAVLPHGIDAESVDQEPVRLIFLVVSPERSPAAHLQTLAAISRWLKDDRNLERVRSATTAEEARECLCGVAGGSPRA